MKEILAHKNELDLDKYIEFIKNHQNLFSNLKKITHSHLILLNHTRLVSIKSERVIFSHWKKNLRGFDKCSMFI